MVSVTSIPTHLVLCVSREDRRREQSCLSAGETSVQSARRRCTWRRRCWRQDTSGTNSAASARTAENSLTGIYSQNHLSPSLPPSLSPSLSLSNLSIYLSIYVYLSHASHDLSHALSLSHTNTLSNISATLHVSLPPSLLSPSPPPPLYCSTTLRDHEGNLYCPSCYSRNFGIKGYGYGGGAGTLGTDGGSTGEGGREGGKEAVCERRLGRGSVCVRERHWLDTHSKHSCGINSCSVHSKWFVSSNDLT